jgi:hypothetical protein
MNWFDKTLSAVGLARKPEPRTGNAPRAHHEYFVDPKSEGFAWLARFYQADGVVREETGAEKTSAGARKAAQAWCKKQGEAQ